MLLASNQAIVRNLVATLLPYAPCARQFSELRRDILSGGDSDEIFEFTVQDELEFEFSFKPAILRN